MMKRKRTMVFSRTASTSSSVFYRRNVVSRAFIIGKCRTRTHAFKTFLEILVNEEGYEFLTPWILVDKGLESLRKTLALVNRLLDLCHQKLTSFMAICIPLFSSRASLRIRSNLSLRSTTSCTHRKAAATAAAPDRDGFLVLTVSASPS
jgi:hypothetical protein